MPSNKRPALPDGPFPKGQNAHRHAKRQKCCNAKFATEGHLHTHNAPAVEGCMAHSTSHVVADLPAAMGGYIGQDGQCSRRLENVEWYRSQPDWQYVKWDGSDALAIIDEVEHVYVVGLKKIRDP
ncbi:hypothetical protein V5O48_014170 [Marasmius crinis-equi]|uniref:Uncharacterized protein n=1 Tax=Marasmius crinis-equi TaxID=585013 RepID=A0ABR3EY26_9AGAR